MRRLLLLCLLSLAAPPAGAQPFMTGSLPAAPAEALAEPAATVDLAEGEARILDAANGERPARAGDALYAGESIVTGADGELHLSTADGGYLGVRPETRLRIAEFRAEGDDEDRALYELLDGSIRSITGWIGRLRERYTIKTAAITIGVRGTDHEIAVIAEGSARGEPGTHVKVNAGASYIQSPQGRVEIDAGRAGYAPRRAGERPRLHARAPPLFRATRNERRFDGLHERLHERLETRRVERRRAVAEQRARPVERRAPLRDAREPRRAPAPQLREEGRKAVDAPRAAPKAQGRPGAERKAAAPGERRIDPQQRKGPRAGERRSDAPPREAREPRRGGGQKDGAAKQRPGGPARRD